MDEMDYIQENEEQRIASILAKKRMELEKINALGVPKIRFCNNCGEEIPTARLKSIPGAYLCVDCQSNREK